jgi:hypothetical protein
MGFKPLCFVQKDRLHRNRGIFLFFTVRSDYVEISEAGLPRNVDLGFRPWLIGNPQDILFSMLKLKITESKEVFACICCQFGKEEKTMLIVVPEVCLEEYGAGPSVGSESSKNSALYRFKKDRIFCHYSIQFENQVLGF